jgi:drug/metabolite transporter (DMT)-like permease
MSNVANGTGRAVIDMRYVVQSRSASPKESFLPADRSRFLGIVFVLLSAAAWSLNGLYTRVLTIDSFTTLAGRGVAAIIMISTALLIMHGRDTRRLLFFNLRHGLLAIVCGSASMIFFVTALFNTTVANVTVIYAVSPLMAAVLARAVIGDRLVARTLIAFGGALVGVAIMVGASFGTGRLFGDFLALMMSVTFAIVMVEMRRRPKIDNLTATLWMSVLTALVMTPFASLPSITGIDVVVLFLFSFTSNILGFFLFISGVRRIPPAEAGLIATVEIVLAPFWVWLVFSERPSQATMIGGAIVLAAVFYHLTGELRRAGAGEHARLGRASEVETADEVL